MDSITAYDAIVIGAGPSGSTAALYAARASLDVLVIEQGMPGGQIATSDMVDNYPGIPNVSGAELGQKMLDHAESAGAHVEYTMVTSISRRADGRYEVATDSGAFEAPALIVATGATPRTAGFAGEEEFRGRGVSYCATCDGMFYRNKKVFVVGGGNSACEEGLFLSRIASEVVMVVRRDEFRAPRGRVDRLLAQKNVSVRFSTSIVEVTGTQLLERIVFRDNVSGETSVEEYPAGSFGIFGDRAGACARRRRRRWGRGDRRGYGDAHAGAVLCRGYAFQAPPPGGHRSVRRRHRRVLRIRVWRGARPVASGRPLHLGT